MTNGWRSDRNCLLFWSSFTNTWRGGPAKVSADFHVRLDNAYYSVDKAYLHKSVKIAVSATTVNIYSMNGELIVSWRGENG